MIEKAPAESPKGDSERTRMQRNRGAGAWRLRRAAVALHRYVGLTLVLFLTVAGLTGSVLVFNDELDSLLNPDLFAVADTGHRGVLDPFELNRRANEQLPRGTVLRSVHFDAEPNRAVTGWTQDSPGVWREWFVDPNGGNVLGSRVWGDISEGTRNLMPFIYRLHYSLALGEVGTVLFGVVALLWTVDCFVGAYLTLPRRRHVAALSECKSWLGRWKTSWLVRANKLFSFIFTWHRASGLWIWVLLVVFAWSAVGFNLRQVYAPVMSGLWGMQTVGHETLPQLSPPYPKPRLSLEEAHERGKRAMVREAKSRGFSIFRERSVYYAEDHGAFGYIVESSLDVSRQNARTEVYLDGQSGDYLGFSAPTGITIGNTLSTWLSALHTASVFGTWYRVVVVVAGLLVSGLSVTGAWIWWHKRARRRSSRSAGVARLDSASPLQAKHPSEAVVAATRMGARPHASSDLNVHALNLHGEQP